MESAVDRTEVSQAATTHDDVAVPEAGAVPQGPEMPLDHARDTTRRRQFDDIPSVVRALLVGYDEA